VLGVIDLVPLFDAIVALLMSVWEVVVAVLTLAVVLIRHYWPAVLWLLFCLGLIRGSDVREQLRQGAWVGLILLWVLVAVVWGLCTEPGWAGLGLSSVAEKFILTGLWGLVAYGCWRLQEHFGWSPPEITIAGPPEGGAPASHHGGHDH
jgi:hypothetical protein